jgi:hypothetical protein
MKKLWKINLFGRWVMWRVILRISCNSDIGSGLRNNHIVAYILVIIVGLLALVALSAAERVTAQEKAPPPRAKDDDDIDYEIILNDRLDVGLLPETNAVVLLWKALGPIPEGGDRMPAEFFKWLGIEEPPKKGEYFVRLDSYLKNRTKLTQAGVADVRDQLVKRACESPWQEKDHPHLAAWLKANEKPLALVKEACTRPDYYNPLISRSPDGRPKTLIGAPMPAVQPSRELAAALRARAMLSISAGQIDAASNDLLACHRLARHIGSGHMLTEANVGISIDREATSSDLAFLETANLPAKAILDRLDELKSLPPLPSMAEKINFAERMIFLQTLDSVRRDSGKSLLGSLNDKLEKQDSAIEIKHVSIYGREELEEIRHAIVELKEILELTEQERAVWATLDWEPAITYAKRWYDEMVWAMQIKDRAQRKERLDRISEILVTTSMKARADRVQLSKRLQTKKPLPKNINLSITITIPLLRLLGPNLEWLADSQDRALQIEGNLHVAFALAAYKSDHGRYPAKLADLSPKYLAKVSDDLFSGKPLIYRPTEKGYVLYSVGVNGKDEDGRGMDDVPSGDDLRVRMPLPPIKK